MTQSRTVIVKIAERCNLACPYCYMYSGPDQSWRNRPRRLGSDNVTLLIERCGELLDLYPDVHLTLEFHGGEPLLFGYKRFTDLLDRLHARLTNERVTYCMQTNGTLLTDKWCDLFSDHGMHWSISADGPRAVHDRFRFDHQGRGSHVQVEEAILLSLSRPVWRRWFGGVLAVIDPAADGRSVVHYFHKLGVRNLDLMMPDATWVTSPAHLPGFSQAALRRFMSEAFAAWVALDDPRFHLRTFEHFAKGFYGQAPELDAFGAGLDWLTVVESDGSYQLLDVLHICGEEYTSIGGDLAGRSLAEQYELQAKAAVPPCTTCKACPVFDICGGGYLPHRFDGESFDNPSVYCETLMSTIGEVEAYLRSQLPQEVWKSAS